MKITDEILAAYVDGTLPAEQTDEVRLYVASHPEELEQLVKLMDRYPQETNANQPPQSNAMGYGAAVGAVGGVASGAMGGMIAGSLLASSGAAFIGRTLRKTHQPQAREVDIQANITNLLDEIL